MAIPTPDPYPVAIIGGGPVGLTTSIYLSLHGIAHILFEHHPSTSIHPKALGLNQRSIEIFRQLGLEDEIKRVRCPPENFSRTAWYTSLSPGGGDNDGDGDGGREIYSRDAWGGGQYREEYDRASPCQYTILPQIRLEPILHRRARELNPEGIVNNATVVGIEEREDLGLVRLRVQFRNHNQNKGNSNDGKVVEAHYVIGADGGRMVADTLGIAMQGEKDVVDMVSAHIQAPLSQHLPDPRVFIAWFINPLQGGSIGSGYLYHAGPYPMQPETEEWMFACALNPADPRKFETGDMLKRIHQTLRIPGLGIQVKSLSHWLVNSIVAERFRSSGGRVFLVGDAAHRIPPWGALGLNTGLQDVQNLIWKLAYAVKAGQGGSPQKYDALLDTYEAERRPIALRVASGSLSNLQNHALVMDRALGITPDASPEENVKSLNAFLDAKDRCGDHSRDAVDKAQAVLDTEFHAPGAEIGWFYSNCDDDNDDDDNDYNSNHGGQLKENGDFEMTTYHPSILPGHIFPHMWLTKNGENRVSTRDLLVKDKCVLFARTERAWTHLESDLVHVELIDGSNGNWQDVDGKWSEFCLPGRNLAAALVRPDGIVLWTSQDSGPSKERVTASNFDDLVRQKLRLPMRETEAQSSTFSNFRGSIGEHSRTGLYSYV